MSINLSTRTVLIQRQLHQESKVKRRLLNRMHNPTGLACFNGPTLQHAGLPTRPIGEELFPGNWYLKRLRCHTGKIEGHPITSLVPSRLTRPGSHRLQNASAAMEQNPTVRVLYGRCSSFTPVLRPRSLIMSLPSALAPSCHRALWPANKCETQKPVGPIFH